jgi:hypothetical protein
MRELPYHTPMGMDQRTGEIAGCRPLLIQVLWELLSRIMPLLSLYLTAHR